MGGRLADLTRFGQGAGVAHMQERMAREAKTYPTTPDGRYFVVRGRLWRTSDPSLGEEERGQYVSDLMKARRDVASARRADDRTAEQDARSRVDAAKRALGERGPVWWTDGAPDWNRHLARNTPYAQWFADLETHQRA